jgi:predicted nucleotide-binding protein
MPDSALPKLLVSQSDAKKKIAEQISKGRRIQESSTLVPFGHPDNREQLTKAKADAEKWVQYTIDLLRSLFSDPSIAAEFGYLRYRPPSFGLPAKHFNEWMEKRIVSLESIEDRIDLYLPIENETKVPAAPTKPSSRDIFIVHGHDGGAKNEVARFLQSLDLNPIILHEKPNKGHTIIEKVEAHSNVGFAVVLLTPDDTGYPKGKPAKKKHRARQNVVLELGYFIGKLGRKRVAALVKGAVELPSDFSGVLYISMDRRGAWRSDLASEINEAGIDVDLNKIL